MIRRDYISHLSSRNRVKSVSSGDVILFRYLTFDIYHQINQHVAYHTVVHYVRHLWD